MKTQTNPLIEQQLIRRLKILGIVLFLFALLAPLYQFIPQFEEELDEEIKLALEEDAPPLSPLFVSTSFIVVGSSCVFFSWKARRRLEKA